VAERGLEKLWGITGHSRSELDEAKSCSTDP